MAAITVNGVQHEVQAPGDTPLLYVLRNDLHLSGPQFGCGMASHGFLDHVDGARTLRSDFPAARARPGNRRAPFGKQSDARSGPVKVG